MIMQYSRGVKLGPAMRLMQARNSAEAKSKLAQPATHPSETATKIHILDVNGGNDVEKQSNHHGVKAKPKLKVIQYTHGVQTKPKLKVIQYSRGVKLGPAMRLTQARNGAEAVAP